MTNACAEGADVPDDSPIAVVLFGKEFATTADEKTGSNVSMHGPNSLARLAEHLMALGHDPDRELSLYRAGQFIGKTSISEAAKAFT
jgi:hypothetical protein